MTFMANMKKGKMSKEQNTAKIHEKSRRLAKLADHEDWRQIPLCLTQRSFSVVCT
jgi:hypothetical protein